MPPAAGSALWRRPHRRQSRRRPHCPPLPAAAASRTPNPRGRPSFDRRRKAGGARPHTGGTPRARCWSNPTPRRPGRTSWIQIRSSSCTARIRTFGRPCTLGTRCPRRTCGPSRTRSPRTRRGDCSNTPRATRRSRPPFLARRRRPSLGTARTRCTSRLRRRLCASARGRTAYLARTTRRCTACRSCSNT